MAIKSLVGENPKVTPKVFAGEVLCFGLRTMQNDWAAGLGDDGMTDKEKEAVDEQIATLFGRAAKAMGVAPEKLVSVCDFVDSLPTGEVEEPEAGEEAGEEEPPAEVAPEEAIVE